MSYIRLQFPNRTRRYPIAYSWRHPSPKRQSVILSLRSDILEEAGLRVGDAVECFEGAKDDAGKFAIVKCSGKEVPNARRVRKGFNSSGEIELPSLSAVKRLFPRVTSDDRFNMAELKMEKTDKKDGALSFWLPGRSPKAKS